MNSGNDFRRVQDADGIHSHSERKKASVSCKRSTNSSANNKSQSTPFHASSSKSNLSVPLVILKNPDRIHANELERQDTLEHRQIMMEEYKIKQNPTLSSSNILAPGKIPLPSAQSDPKQATTVKNFTTDIEADFLSSTGEASTKFGASIPTITTHHLSELDKTSRSRLSSQHAHYQHHASLSTQHQRMINGFQNSHPHSPTIKIVNEQLQFQSLLSNQIKAFLDTSDTSTSAPHHLQNTNTPSSDCLVIGVIGPQSVGKSTLMNALYHDYHVSKNNSTTDPSHTQSSNLAGNENANYYDLNDPFKVATPKTLVQSQHQTTGIDMAIGRIDGHFNTGMAMGKLTASKPSYAHIHTGASGLNGPAPSSPFNITGINRGDQLVLLDVQPLPTAMMLANLKRSEPQLMSDTKTYEHMIHLSSLQIGLFLLSSCHILLFVDDRTTVFDNWKHLHTLEMLKWMIPDVSEMGSLPTASLSIPQLKLNLANLRRKERYTEAVSGYTKNNKNDQDQSMAMSTTLRDNSKVFDKKLMRKKDGRKQIQSTLSNTSNVSISTTMMDDEDHIHHQRHRQHHQLAKSSLERDEEAPGHSLNITGGCPSYTTMNGPLAGNNPSSLVTANPSLSLSPLFLQSLHLEDDQDEDESIMRALDIISPYDPDTEYFPTIMFVFNKVSQLEMSEHFRAKLRTSLENYFQNSRLFRHPKHNDLLSTCEDLSISNQIPENTKIDLFLIPNVSDNSLIGPSPQNCFMQFTHYVLSMSRGQFKKPLFSSKEWLLNASKLWEIIKQSPALSQYNEVLKKTVYNSVRTS